MLTLMTPSLLGIPLEWYRTDVKAEVQIIDSRGEVIGTYAGRGRSKVRVAMYHGYGQSKAARLADVPNASPLYVHCGSGLRASLAVPYLVSKGYKVVYVDGSFDDISGEILE